MEKAYDRMSWDTIVQILSLFGFPQRFVTWLLQCVQAPKFTLLLNGCRSRWIEGGCGYLQGFSISPYLFIL
ncbi:hypothetical protein KSP39_PZI014056 [Platanthera zijinensis]|uniref:Reverse transcriptase domain-containing protein n=1 Tax=Platanthera zijinensis TaxID=2320716 RepID=A0AAP0BBH1_9ASPA